MSKSKATTVLFQLYYLALASLVVLFWTHYFILVFSYKRAATDSTPFANFLRILPGNIRLFRTGYDVNIIFVLIGSAHVFYFGIFLNVLYLCCDEGKLWRYDAITSNVYLPKCIRNRLSAVKRTNAFRTNFLLTFFLPLVFINEFIADVCRSIHSLLPKNLALLRIRLENGGSFSTSLRNVTGEQCRSGNCRGKSWTDEYYARIGLQRICTEGRIHGGLGDVQTAKNIQGIVDGFEKQEKLLYALANSGLTQAALGMSIKEYSDISGADIYTRFAVLLAVFTISFTTGPFLKIRTFDRLKKT